MAEQRDASSSPGPALAPASGRFAGDEESARKNWRLVNEDPCGAGWPVKIRPAAWEADIAELVAGSAGLETSRALLEREGIHYRGTS